MIEGMALKSGELEKERPFSMPSSLLEGVGGALAVRLQVDGETDPVFIPHPNEWR